MQKLSKAALLMTYKRSRILSSELALVGPISQWELLCGPTRATDYQRLPVFDIFQSSSISVESSIDKNNLNNLLSIKKSGFERCLFNQIKDFYFPSDPTRAKVYMALLEPVDRWRFLAGPSRAKTKKAPVRSLLLLEVTK